MDHIDETPTGRYLVASSDPSRHRARGPLSASPRTRPSPASANSSVECDSGHNIFEYRLNLPLCRIHTEGIFVRVRNRAVSGAEASSLLATPSPADAIRPRQMGAGAALSTLPTLRTLCSFASRLACMTQWAQALPVAVDVLATSPQRDGVIQLEGPRSAGRDVDQFSARCAVGPIP